MSLESSDEVDIREGFICSECSESFDTMNNLLVHYNTSHHEEVASKEIPNKNEFKTSPTKNKQATYPIRPQTIGLSTSHVDYFTQIRENRVQWQREQFSTLIGRLNKLTNIEGDDLVGNKQLIEKQVVNWVADQYVSLCPSCARPFNLTRRRHHCRLCGAIMCHPCSQFLEYETARKLISCLDSSDQEEEYEDEGKKDLERPSSAASTSSPFNKSFGQLAQFGSALSSSLKTSIRRGSTSSLLSVVAQSTKDQTSIRICSNCKVTLDKKGNKLDADGAMSLICALYSKLQSRMDECEKLIPNYEKISSDLNCKDPNSSSLFSYDYEEAQELRIKLIRMSEEIDIISRKINTLGVTDATPPPVTQIQLQSKIRMAAANFLKSKTLRIQSLPSEEEIKEMREKRKKLQEATNSSVIRKSDSNGKFVDQRP